MSIITCQDIFSVMEEIAPSYLALDWDNSGLQVGDPKALVNKILLSLDMDKEVLEEAKSKGCQLIITHHPFLFKGLKKINLQSSAGILIKELILNKINLFSAHTNLDCTEEGVNDVLARLLGLKDLKILENAPKEQLVKLVVYVPLGYEKTVFEKICKAGAGCLGEYENCSFQTKGTGTFKPKEEANPFIGSKGELSLIEEVRIEVVVRKKKIKAVVEAMLKVHPYEEVAYEYFDFQQENLKQGLGRIGQLENKITLGEFLEIVKKNLNISSLRFGGDLKRPISKIALCSGSGSDLWHLAKNKGADLLLTGDLKYHVARDILESGLFFIDAGHYATEIIILPILKKKLEEYFKNQDIEIYLSETKQNPFSFL